MDQAPEVSRHLDTVTQHRMSNLHRGVSDVCCSVSVASVASVVFVVSVASVGSVGSVGLMTPHPTKNGPPGLVT